MPPRVLVLFAREPRRQALDKGLAVDSGEALFAAFANGWIDAAAGCGASVIVASIRVRFSSGVENDFDSVVALTGFRPDLSFVSELALEISPATEGSARLSRALSNVTDCLSVPAIAAADLGSGEPGFYLLGAKSYGRSRTFLLRTGLAHLEAILPAVESCSGTAFA